MECSYDFLPLTGLFPKVALIHNRLFEAVKADFSLFKSAKANFYDNKRYDWVKLLAGRKDETIKSFIENYVQAVDGVISRE